MALLPRKPAKHPAKPKRGKKLEVEEPGVLYGRYSSHNQKDISVEQQFEKGYELAAEYGIRIIDTYADRAVSGRTDKRRDFQRMMTDAAKGKFRYVIAWKSNRMGRNMLEALINEARLQDLGVRVLYVEEDFDDTAAGRFAARSMMNVNQFYSENMAEDIKRGVLALSVTLGAPEEGAVSQEWKRCTMPSTSRKLRLSGRYSLAFPAVRLSLISWPA